MKKIVFGLLGSLLFSSVYADWVFIAHQAGSQKDEIIFTDFVSPDYDDYVFIFDMLEPLSGFEDTVMQASTDSGTSWITTYTGGSTAISPIAYDPSMPRMNPAVATTGGLPITNVANAGYYFIGEVRISNLHDLSGPITVKGFGQMGNDNHGSIFGTFGATTGVNAVRFVSANPSLHPRINRYDITVYGLSKN